MRLLREFREFAVKGSVVDLAVGVIIGVASARCGLAGRDIIMPAVGRSARGFQEPRHQIGEAKIHYASSSIPASTSAHAVDLVA